MKKDSTMKKNSFLNGALLITLGIVFTKILGVIYVIPFHSLIGEAGGALYGYAYNIYVFFISLSSAGIPLAISKITSEYQALGNYDAKERAFYLGKKISLILGFLFFLILIIFAPLFANIILGDLNGGNSIKDVILVIRIISTAILVVPVLGVYRGYFQGHNYMEPSSISQVLEQLARVIIIIFGSFLTLKVFNLSLATSVGVAIFGATIGALTAYMYLLNKKFRNKSKFKGSNQEIKIKVSDKEIIRKIIYYAFPLIIIDLSRSIYNFVDTFTVVTGLVNRANYDVKDAEVVVSMLSTWATKFNMIISSVSTGIVVSLVPSLTSSIVKDDENDSNNKVNQAISLGLLLIVPMTFGIAFLSKSIWTLFYGASEVGPTLLNYFIFTGLFSSLFTIIITTIQVYKEYKVLLISLLLGVIVKVLFNVNLITSFYKMGLPAYYGVITATIFGYLISIAYSFIYLNKKVGINFDKLIANVMDIVVSTIIMMFILVIIGFVIPTSSSSRILSLIIIIFYACMGSCIYFYYLHKVKCLDRILGRNFINKIIKNSH